MYLSGYTLPAVLGLFTLAHTAPTPPSPNSLSKRTFDCTAPVHGLLPEDCSYMSSIGMFGQGVNAVSSSSSPIWIGTDGPNTFTFTNGGTNPSPVPIILVIWDQPAGDYQSSFMNVRAPKISYSLPNINDTVTISLANGVSGGWATLNDRKTTLSQYGQIYNTWGEFTTGDWATVDISREVNMQGNVMSLKVATGCRADMATCAFACKDGQSCGASGSYHLMNCDAATMVHAAYGTYDGVNPSGGCQGWSNGGHIDISLGNY